MIMKRNPMITPRIAHLEPGQRMEGLKTSVLNLRCIGMLYENESGERFISPNVRHYFYPQVLVPEHEVGFERCSEHGVVVSRCAHQHHAHKARAIE